MTDRAIIPPTWESDCGTVRLWLGDCLEVMRSWPDGAVDAVVTDPPYGESHSSGWKGRFHGKVIIGDGSTNSRDEALDILGCGEMAVFGKWSVPIYGTPKAVVVWDKGPANGMGDLEFPFKPSWEEIAIYGTKWRGSRDEGVIKGHTVVTWSGKPGQRIHPNEKPASLLQCLIKKHPGQTIADPFMGSGTTGVAAVRLGRKFWGVEIDPEYFEGAKKRIQEELRRFKFLEPKPKQETQSELFSEETA